MKEIIKKIAKMESLDEQKEMIFKLANDDFGGNTELVWSLVEEEILNNSLQKEYMRIYG